MESFLLYYYSSPFLMFTSIITAIFMSKSVISLSNKIDNFELFALVTSLASIVGGIEVTVSAIFLFFKVKWFYLLYALASIAISPLIMLIIRCIVQEFSFLFSKDRQPNETTWFIECFLLELITIPLFYMGIFGLYRYVVALF